MSVLIIYDSFFGNTEQVARAVGAQCGGTVVKAADFDAAQLSGVDFLIVGSPTRGFRPSENVSKLLKALPDGALKGKRAAAFDTRMTEKAVAEGPFFLRWLVNLFGYAAKPIAAQLEKKGAAIVLPAEGFYVEKSEGPLVAGELERAGAWGMRCR